MSTCPMWWCDDTANHDRVPEEEPTRKYWHSRSWGLPNDKPFADLQRLQDGTIWFYISCEVNANEMPILEKAIIEAKTIVDWIEGRVSTELAKLVVEA